MTAAAVTIVAKNYLAFARTLMASVRRFHPEWRRVVVIADRLEGEFDPGAEDFEVVLSESLPIPDKRWFHFKYTLLELSTALKPYALASVEADRVIYFDPDIRLYAALEPWPEAEILLTPHLTQPMPDDDRLPQELNILQSGAYNLGFIGLRRNPRFLEWWQRKVHDGAYVDLKRGLFTDQRWMDLTPSLFSGVRIERSPAWNVAYWNLQERRIERRGNRWFVNGEPLRFFHFSGIDPEAPAGLSKHQNRFCTADLGQGAELVHEYCAEVLANGHRVARTWPYAYGRFENGERVLDICRRVRTHAADPFSSEGYQAYLEWWNGDVFGRPPGGPAWLSRIARFVWEGREDLQRLMPDLRGRDGANLLDWLARHGQAEIGLPEHFIEPARAYMGMQSFLREKSAAGLDGTARQWLRNHLATLVYESREDLQTTFPEARSGDASRYYAWLLTHGRREYKLDRDLLEPVAQAYSGGAGRLMMERIKASIR